MFLCAKEKSHPNDKAKISKAVGLVLKLAVNFRFNLRFVKCGVILHLPKWKIINQSPLTDGNGNKD